MRCPDIQCPRDHSLRYEHAGNHRFEQGCLSATEHRDIEKSERVQRECARDVLQPQEARSIPYPLPIPTT